MSKQGLVLTGPLLSDSIYLKVTGAEPPVCGSWRWIGVFQHHVTTQQTRHQEKPHQFSLTWASAAWWGCAPHPLESATPPVVFRGHCSVLSSSEIFLKFPRPTKFTSELCQAAVPGALGGGVQGLLRNSSGTSWDSMALLEVAAASSKLTGEATCPSQAGDKVKTRKSD